MPSHDEILTHRGMSAREHSTTKPTDTNNDVNTTGGSSLPSAAAATGRSSGVKNHAVHREEALSDNLTNVRPSIESTETNPGELDKKRTLIEDRGQTKRGRDRHEEAVGDNRNEPLSVLIRNLDPGISPDYVRGAFEQFGEVRDVYLPCNHQTRVPRGFGFVEFVHSQDAVEAIATMDGSQFRGQQVSCTEARRGRRTSEEMRSKIGQRYRGGDSSRGRSDLPKRSRRRSFEPVIRNVKGGRIVSILPDEDDRVYQRRGTNTTERAGRECNNNLNVGQGFRNEEGYRAGNPNAGNIAYRGVMVGRQRPSSGSIHEDQRRGDRGGMIQHSNQNIDTNNRYHNEGIHHYGSGSIGYGSNYPGGDAGNNRRRSLTPPNHQYHQAGLEGGRDSGNGRGYWTNSGGACGNGGRGTTSPVGQYERNNTRSGLMISSGGERRGGMMSRSEPYGTNINSSGDSRGGGQGYEVTQQHMAPRQGSIIERGGPQRDKEYIRPHRYRSPNGTVHSTSYVNEEPVYVRSQPQRGNNNPSIRGADATDNGSRTGAMSPHQRYRSPEYHQRSAVDDRRYTDIPNGVQQGRGDQSGRLGGPRKPSRHELGHHQLSSPISGSQIPMRGVSGPSVGGNSRHHGSNGEYNHRHISSMHDGDDGNGCKLGVVEPMQSSSQYHQSSSIFSNNQSRSQYPQQQNGRVSNNGGSLHMEEDRNSVYIRQRR